MLEYLPSFEREILSRLRLNASDAARVCGITPRRLKYWAQKGFVPTVDDSHNFYDFDSFERAILIRRRMDDGYTLSVSNDATNNLLTDETEQRQNLEELSDGEVEGLVLNYLEQLEERISSLRGELPTYLTLSRLGATARPLDTKQIEQFFVANPFSFDTAPGLALRLGYAADEVVRLLDQLTQAGVLVKSTTEELAVYRLRRDAGQIV